MKTLTPTTDQWETYCDECYYHMWRLRRKTERGWHDGFHVHTEEEAKGLCDLLNKLERELDELRRWTSVNGVIELQRERDEARGQVENQKERIGEFFAALEKLISELAEARGQLAEIEDKMRVELGGHPDSELWGEAGLIAATMRCVDALGEVTDQRDEARAEMIRWMSIAEGRGRTDDDDTGKAIAKLIRQRDEARAQRDRLVKLLKPLRYWRDITECVCSDPLPNGGCLRCDLNRADAALQSLTPNA